MFISFLLGLNFDFDCAMKLAVAVRLTLKRMKTKERYSGGRSAIMQACLSRFCNISATAKLLEVILCI